MTSATMAECGRSNRFRKGEVGAVPNECPAKDEINRKKHGVSLRAAADFDWDTALEREDDRFDYGKIRL